MESSFGLKPQVCFAVEKVIGISNDGTYQVQWAPAWVSRFHLVGCEHLIQEFLRQQAQDENQQLVEEQLEETNDVPPQVKSNEVLLKNGLNEAALHARSYEDYHQNEVDDAALLKQSNEVVTQTRLTELQVKAENETLIHINSNSNCTDQDQDCMLDQLSKRDEEVSHRNSDTFHVYKEQNQKCGTRPGRDMFSEYSKQQVEKDHKPAVGISGMKNFPSKPAVTQLDLSSTGNSCQLGTIDHDCTHLKPAYVSVKIEDSQDTEDFNDRSAYLTHSRHVVDDKESYKNYGELARMALVRNEDTLSLCNDDNALLLQADTNSKKTKNVCSFCGEHFAFKSRLTVHLRTHTGVKPYICSYCGKGFIHQGNLNQHLRTHTGEKPFFCEICGKSFSHRNSCDSHMRTHQT